MFIKSSYMQGANLIPKNWPTSLWKVKLFRSVMASTSVRELFKIWGLVAAQSFGGPAGQIAVIHRLVVEEKKIISEERFLHALNFCMLLPGPEAQQLATYMGWCMRGWIGGLIAGGLFILPGFLSILFLSYMYVIYSDLPLIEGLFYGMKPAIIAIVAAALYRISKKSLNQIFHWVLAGFAFFALFFINLSFPLVVLISALSGIVHGKFFKPDNNLKTFAEISLPDTKETFKTIFVWLMVWFFPVFVIFANFGPRSTFHEINLFFSKMSLITFGGAYAALSYVAQKGVEVYGWIQGTEMLDGLAMAETTPGPLIQVVQFVGFMAAYRFPDISSPYMSALLASVLTTWMTFAPCFLFVFSLAPYVEYLRGKKILSDALEAITAAVVGVILNLSLWFAFKALFRDSNIINWGVFNFEYPLVSSLDVYGAFICIVALFLQFRIQCKILTILGICTILGILVKLLIF